MESYRNDQGKPRYRLVISLGGAAIAKEEQPMIARLVEHRLYGYIDLLPETHSETAQGWVDSIIRRIEQRGRWQPFSKAGASGGKNNPETVDGVLIEQVGHNTDRELGPSLVGLHAWNSLKMPELLEQLGLNKAQRQRAAISVINRLVSPISEHGLDLWLQTTALSEILGNDELGHGDDRFYRVSELLLKHQGKIEHVIRQRQGELFQLDRTIVLYDLTNTHFEGLCKENPKAARGHNKQKRNDCLQIVVGMVFDREGFELAHRVFEGNRSDAKSLVDMVDQLEEIIGRKNPQLVIGAVKPLVIVDAGVASRGNLELLRKRGFSYLVNDSRRGRARYAAEFADDSGFSVIGNRGNKPEVRVRLIKEKRRDKDGHEYEELLVLCQSQARGEKENAIISQAEERFIAELEKLWQRVSQGRLKDLKKIERAIGRIQSHHRRIHRYYTVEVSSADGLVSKISWHRRDAEYQEATALTGCYVLRTDWQNLSAEDLWKLYISLTRAEDGFRALKSELGLRPNPHHKELRIDAHVFITVLAYQLLCYIMRSLERKGDHRSWDTIRCVLQSHCYSTIILPTKNGAVHRIRKAGEPEECQKSIYAALGIDWWNLPVTRTVFHHKMPTTA